MAERWTWDYMWGGLNPDFRHRLELMVAASNGAIVLTSGFRDNAHQADLVERAKAKYGDDWRKWAAPPGGSNHNRGLAADLAFQSNDWKQWAHANAAKFGLHFPMSWEPWHIEPLGLAQGMHDQEPWPQAYTGGYGREVNPTDQRLEHGDVLMGLLQGPQPDLEQAEKLSVPGATLPRAGATIDPAPMEGAEDAGNP